MESGCGNRRKNNMSYAYADWCAWRGFEYIFKRYSEESQPIPFIPSEQDLDSLIAGFGRSYSTLLQLLKESGFRTIEACRLTPMDFDLDRGFVTLNQPAKHSLPRQFKMSNRLRGMVALLLKSKSSKDRIWDTKPSSLRPYFSRRRREIAEELHNLNLNKISMKTFRHYFATMLYHKTRDILFVQRALGHKSLKNTLIYTHLLDSSTEEEYSVKIASSIEEFTNLLELGFEYVSDYDNKKILRKRK